MTRIAREQEKLARIPAASVRNCPVEALGRELRPLLRVEDAYSGQAGAFSNIAIDRRYAIMEAGAAFKALSPLGALFQLMLTSASTEAIADLGADNVTRVRELARMTACLHSVAEFLETHFSVDRREVAGDLALDRDVTPLSHQHQANRRRAQSRRLTSFLCPPS
ncbi:MAG: hypothetical protein JWL62_3114 [Hyphomicrobiales bacterium]|nr:hypothetical protein [Hyphomicrobiales bacterium]